MTKYQELFQAGAEQKEIDAIKEAFHSKQVFTWEEYYWGSKCVVEFDNDNSDPKFIIKSLKKAFRNGLNIRNNPELYQDSLRMIAAFYSSLGQYEQVINHLMIYIDSLDEKAPDWAYHDLIKAQMHTDQIDMMLENPKLFLEDLSRNDKHSADIKKKQKNLLRDFLLCSIEYLNTGNKIKINVKELESAAEGYGLKDTEVWKAFSRYMGGGPSKSKAKTAPGSNNHSYGSGGIAKNYVVFEDLLEKAPDTQRIGELSNKDHKANSYILDLEKEIESYKNTVSSLQKLLLKKDQVNSDLQIQLSYADQKSILSREKNVENEERIADLQKKLDENNVRYTKLQNQISDKHEGMAVLQGEIAQLKESINNLEQEKVVLEAENASIPELKNTIGSLNERIIQLGTALEGANKRLELMPEGLEDSDRPSNPEGPTDMEIYGKCYSYLNFYCLEAGKEWLKNNLPKITKDYMELCFFPSLTNSQSMAANEKGWTTIYDFDLAAVLRVIKHNLRNIPSFYPNKDDQRIVSDMIEIRNYYSHPNGWNISNEDALEDIYIMSDFIDLMDGDQDRIDEMRAFADTIKIN